MTPVKSDLTPNREIPIFVPKRPIETSYAAVAQKDQFPKRDQGLILICVEGLNLTEYTCAVGDIVQPKNVISASRISNNRICLYLSNKELVNNITEKHNFLQIGNQKVTIRPLINKQKKIIFSNVPSNIPNYVLEDILEELNIKRGSPVSVLKATIAKEGYNHVTSFRRQVFINPDDVKKLPELFKIQCNEINYFIYTSTDSFKCFICKLEGHLAKNCTNVAEPNANNNTPNTQFENENLEMDTEIITINTEANNKTNVPAKENKRTHSQISSNESHDETDLVQNENANKTKKKPTKIGKTEDDETKQTTNNDKPSKGSETENDETDEDEMDKKLKPIKKDLNQPDKLLNYTQFKSLMENTKGVKNPVEIILQYTQDLESFTKFIKEEVYPNVNNRSIKHRCTTLLKSIKNPVANITPQQTPVNTDDE